MDLYNQGSSGYSTYADATGANGAEGLSRAKSNFTATPGYTEGLNMATDAATRAGNARGVAVGNTLADVTNLATNYANQKYGDYVSRLSPFVGAASSAAGGLAGIYTGEGTALNNSYSNQGNLGYQAQSAIGDASASAFMDRNRASGQIWNALGGAAKLAAAF